MSDAKQRILSRLAEFRRNDVELPTPLATPTVYDDRLAQFRSVLEMVGGQLIVTRDANETRQAIERFEVVRDARRVLSYCPDLMASAEGLDEIHDPHDLADVDVTVAPGEFGVAENGAVWVCDPAIMHRVSLFLSQHLVLVIASGELFNNMHEAYHHIGRVDSPFGGFISGPSKTADIEQSLVIGAHGARSLNVVLVDR